MANEKNRNKMYYRQPLDLELIRAADESTEDSADPMTTDGYGPEQGVEEGPWGMLDRAPKGPSRLTKLRKKGAPKNASVDKE